MLHVSQYLFHELHTLIMSHNTPDADVCVNWRREIASSVRKKIVFSYLLLVIVTSPRLLPKHDN